jgi:hypothetical protein
MGLQAKAGFVGIVTATGEAAASQGALRAADNVTLRRAGALTSRDYWASTNTPSRQYRDVVYFGTGFLYLDVTTTLNVYSSSNVLIQYNRYVANTVTASSPPLVRTDIAQAVEARSNLYLASSAGVMKMTSVSAPTIEPAGIVGTPGVVGEPAVNTSTSAGTPWLAVSSQVAYRFVARYDAPNGLILRSRPSGQVLAVNASGGTANVYLQLTTGAIRTYVTAIEVYRTRTFPVGVTPDDEMQLVGVVPINGTGGGSFGDGVPDVLRTTTLYTSPSRGGIENANDRPPGCACLERFRGAVFFGNTLSPHRAIVSFKYADKTGVATGLGVRTATGNVASGSSAITTVSNVTGLVAGMLVTGNGMPTTGPTYITSVVGSTVNLTAVATGTFGATALRFYDTLLADGSTRIPLIANSGTASQLGYAALNLFVAYEISPPQPGYQATLVVERRYPSDGVFTLAPGTNAADTNLGTGITSTQDALPHGLSWSAPDEPEHVPPKNFARVGDQGRAILGLRATRDALFIFKEDGIFRLSGVDGSYRIDPFDPSAFCILPSSIRRMRNAIYFLSSYGIVEIANDALRAVSQPIENELARIINAIRASQLSTGLYAVPGFAGNAATVDEANGEYWLALGSTTQSYGGQLLVFNNARSGFTTYSFSVLTPPGALAQNKQGQPVYLTANGHFEPTTVPNATTVRVMAHGFTDPALLGKLWTHVVLGVSALTGTSVLLARFSGSEPTSTGTIAEELQAPLTTGTIELPGGSLLRHPVPGAFRRAWALRVEFSFLIDAGAVVIELIGAESRENIPNKTPTHATGTT